MGEEASLTESCLSNLGVASVDSVKKLPFDSKRSNSCNFSSASSHSMERHQYWQRNITTKDKCYSHYYLLLKHTGLGCAIQSFILSRLLLSWSICYRHQLLFELLLNRTLLQGTYCFIVKHAYLCSNILGCLKGFKRADIVYCF